MIVENPTSFDLNDNELVHRTIGIDSRVWRAWTNFSVTHAKNPSTPDLNADKVAQLKRTADFCASLASQELQIFVDWQCAKADEINRKFLSSSWEGLESNFVLLPWFVEKVISRASSQTAISPSRFVADNLTVFINPYLPRWGMRE